MGVGKYNSAGTFVKARPAGVHVVVVGFKTFNCIRVPGSMFLAT